MEKQALDAQELVSVVVPNYNGAAFLEQTLRTLQAQTWSALEIIVVDDGSTDESAEIVERLVREDSRFRLIVQPNGGVGCARNTGAAAAQGLYLAFIDHDDLCHPRKIEQQMRAMQEGGVRIGLVYSWYATIDAEDRIVGVISRPEVEGEALRALCRKNFLGNGSNALIRKRAMDAVGGFPTGTGGCEDLALYMKIAERYEFGVVRQVLLGYRQTLDNMSSDGSKMFLALEEVLTPYYASHPEYTDELEAAKDGLLDWLLLRTLKARRLEPALSLARIMFRRQGVRLLGRLPLHSKALVYAFMPPPIAKVALRAKTALDGPTCRFGEHIGGGDEPWASQSILPHRFGSARVPSEVARPERSGPSPAG